MGAFGLRNEEGGAGGFKGALVAAVMGAFEAFGFLVGALYGENECNGNAVCALCGLWLVFIVGTLSSSVEEDDDEEEEE